MFLANLELDLLTRMASNSRDPSQVLALKMCTITAQQNVLNLFFMCMKVFFFSACVSVYLT